MASVLKVNTLTGVTTAGSIVVTGEGNSTTTNLQQGLVKFYSNINGTGTIATRDSFNQSGITDNGTGDYDFAFTNNMGNDDYTTMVGCDSASNHLCMHYSEEEQNAGGCRCSVLEISGPSATDTAVVMMDVHGDLA
jgi:hypothetical protein